MGSRIARWLNERFPIRAMMRWSLEEEIPGGDSFWYCFGSACLFAFVIQAVTGIWQLFYYVPARDYAYQSVIYLRQEVPFGWLIHGLHYWGSNAFVVLVGLHIARVFIWGAYKKPRQLTWMIGSCLVLTVLALSFVGALLAWDELGYWAAEVGTSIAGTTPLIGSFLKIFLRGGAAMSQMTLSRFFVLHAFVLPGLLGILIILHLVAFKQFGSVGPWDQERRKKMGLFWPNQVLKDLIAVSVIFLILVGLSAFWPAPVTGPADEVDTTYVPKPEWQFLFLYQFIKLFKGPWESVGTVGVPLLLFLILILLPFYDRSLERNPLKRPAVMAGGAAFVAWLITYTILGYLSNTTPPVSGAPLLLAAPLPPGAQKGADLFQKQGCMVCHTVNGQGGSIGPDLSKEGARGRSRQWLTQQIRDAKSHNASTVMPPFTSLIGSEVNNLVEFLETLGKGGAVSPVAPAAPVEAPASDAAAPRPSPTYAITLSTMSPEKTAGEKGEAIPSASVERGKNLFPTLACIGCHAIGEKGGIMGPDLSGEGSKGHPLSWITGQIRDPHAHNPNTIMPAFKSLSEQQVNDLANYLEGLTHGPGKDPPGEADPLTSSSDPPDSPSDPYAAPLPPSSAPPNSSPDMPATGTHARTGPAALRVGNPFHGGLLYEKNCISCHGPEGTDNVPNSGSDDGKVPALNPIDPELYSKDPLTFARTIDRFIQHGSVPSGKHPEKVMPAFGDKLILTQEMISQIEAYILSLNGVNRAAIRVPGMQPRKFFILTAVVLGLLWSVIGFCWVGWRGK